jgi:hypothetical protein
LEQQQWLLPLLPPWPLRLLLLLPPSLLLWLPGLLRLPSGRLLLLLLGLTHTRASVLVCLDVWPLLLLLPLLWPQLLRVAAVGSWLRGLLLLGRQMLLLLVLLWDCAACCSQCLLYLLLQLICGIHCCCSWHKLLRKRIHIRITINMFFLLLLVLAAGGSCSAAILTDSSSWDAVAAFTAAGCCAGPAAPALTGVLLLRWHRPVCIYAAE